MILKRVYFNIAIFSHCIKILYFYKFKKFRNCLQIIESKKTGKSLNLSPIYLSKKITFFSNFLFHNNCFYKSMCLYSLLNQNNEIDLIIGVKKDKKNEFSSHSWIEFKGYPINEGNSISKYKPIYSLRKK